MTNVDEFDESASNQQPTKKTKSSKESTTPILDNFSRNINKLVNEGKIDPVIGRENEVKRLVQILSNKKKNNSIIVGEAGIGKTALVEKLALLIEKGGNSCPISLQNKRIMALDLTSLVSGTKFRGQFEERMMAILKELQNEKNVIVFIDEIHIMIGAGNGSNGMDVANILKPALARGEIQVIGATTFDEYKKSIEKDKALSRRFQKINLYEPTIEESVIILKNIRSNYEEYHGVKYSDEIIELIVKLTNRYITDRQNPDKSIDIMDEIGSQKKVSQTLPISIVQLKEERESVKLKKIEAITNQKFEEAAKLRDKEQTLFDKIKIEISEWEKSNLKNKFEITSEDVYDMISITTGIPISKLDSNETDNLLNIEKLIGANVIGQDNAIESIAQSIRRNRVGIRDTNKIIGSYLFVGETGAGKTHLAKNLSLLLFGSEKNMIRLDMSEYMEKHTVSKLIGSPPGYVGYEEGGMLTEKVKNNPFSVILLDEIEKAHPDVRNILLQVLEDGRLSDSLGKTINFTNTVIIMTSNVGAKKVNDFGNGVGFKTSQSAFIDIENKKGIIKTELKKVFSPEFLNRIDDIVIFNKLTKDNLKEITKIQLALLSKRLTEQNLIVSFDDSIVTKILDITNEENYGARPIKRNIQYLIENYLATQILLKNKLLEKACTLYYENNELILK